MRRRRKILSLAPEIPFPPRGGGGLRTYHLLRALVEEFEVTLVAFGEPMESVPPIAIEVVPVTWEPPALYERMWSEDTSGADAAVKTLSAEDFAPWFASALASPAFDGALHRLKARSFDAVLIEHSAMAQFMDRLSASVPVVLDMHNVHALMARREAAAASADVRPRLELEARRTEAFERACGLACTEVVVVSEVEAAAAREMLGLDRVFVAPNGVDTEFFVPDDREEVEGSLLFSGRMDYPPNVQAVQFFVAEILPAIISRVRRARLNIVGANPSSSVLALQSDHVVVHGTVADVRPYFRAAQVIVVPLLNGGGTRLKILEAAASGKAIVTTALGVEGLGFSSGSELLVADVAEEFAERVVELLVNAPWRRSLARRARNVALGYDWREPGRVMRQVVGSVIPGYGDSSLAVEYRQA